MNREIRSKIAAETLEILSAGTYRTPGGATASIAAELAAACQATQLYRPDELARILLEPGQPAPAPDTTLRVSGVGTLDAGEELTRRYAEVACLNFASAKKPGGGFQTGAQAQEECLARASGLFATLQVQPEFYAYHHRNPTPLYSDHLIYSPGVPVFRDGRDQLIEKPWKIDMITSAAVNAGAVRQNEPGKVREIRPAMERRIRCVLAAAAANGGEALILGAWGCGVFKNDPNEVAELFAAALESETFRLRFRHVEFAILDGSPGQTTLRAFEKVFGSRA